MKLEEIKKLISEGESVTLELKKSTAQLKGAIETICAYLNTKGGFVVIGVNQHGKIVGQNVTDNTQQEIANEISKIEPFPESVNIEYLPLNNKENCSLILISTDRGYSIPYTYDGRSFYRNQATTMRIPQYRYSQLLLERSFLSSNSWDTQPEEGATIDDLDIEEIRRTVEIAVEGNRLNTPALRDSPKNVLKRLELLKNNQLTHAALVLFTKSDKFDNYQLTIKMARFRGLTKTEGFIDNQMVSGHAFKVMHSANEFLMKHLNIASFFDPNKFERIDEPTLPILAFREALSNAICHKDYLFNNTAITVAIFDDRLEIWNNGTLPSFLSIDDLKKDHQSYPRNKKIAQVFYLRHIVETWGTGTNKMIALCRELKMPDPVFKEYSGGLSVTFKFKEKIGFRSGIGTAKGSPNFLKHPTERHKNILTLLKKSQALSAKEIHNQLSIQIGYSTIRADLSALQQQGLVKQIGKGRSSLWQLNR